MLRRLLMLGALAAAAGCGGAPHALARPSGDRTSAVAPTRAAATPSWLAATTPDGPYRDLAAFCAAKAKDASDAEAGAGDPDACGAQGTAVSAGGATVQVVRQPGDATAPDCALALHTAAG